MSGSRAIGWRIGATLAIILCVGGIGRATARFVAGVLNSQNSRGTAGRQEQRASEMTALRLPGAPPTSEQPFPDCWTNNGRTLLRRYTSSAPTDTVIAFYRRKMRRTGWTEVDSVSDRASTLYPGEMMLFTGPGTQCIVAVSESEISGYTTVSIVAGRAAGKPGTF